MSTENLRIPELTQTQNQKVVTINNALNALDNANNKVLSKPITGNVSLTTAEWYSNGIVVLSVQSGSSLSGDPVITCPINDQRSIKFVNLLGRSCTLRCGSDTNTVSLSNNEGKIIGSNGTRLFDLSGSSSGGGSGLNAEEVRDTVANFATDTDTIDFTHDDSANTLKAAVKSNSIGADEINVSGNGSSGQALLSDGDGSFSFGNAGGETFGALYTANNTTHEASWTSLPSTTTRIRVIFDDLDQPSGATVRSYLIQLGVSSGYVTSGYTAGCIGYGDSTWGVESSGFCIKRSFPHNGAVGEVIISRLTASSNIWVAGGTGGGIASNDIPVLVLGRISLASTLDRIRVIMKDRSSGQQFNSGHVCIAYS